MRRPDLRAQRDILAILVAAHAFEHELLGYPLRDARPVLQLDQVQHEVERRRAARTGETIPVDAEHLVVELYPRKFLAQRRQVLPMDRGAVVVEQARPGQGIAAGAQRAERNPALGQAAKRREEGGRHRLADIDAAADEEDFDLAELLERNRRGEVEAAAREDGAAIEAHDRPLVNVLTHDPVGHAQGLDRVRDGDQRVIRQGQESVPGLFHTRTKYATHAGRDV